MLYPKQPAPTARGWQWRRQSRARGAAAVPAQPQVWQCAGGSTAGWLTGDEDPVPPLPRLLSGHHPHGLHHVTVDIPEPLHVREAARVAHHLRSGGSVSTHPAPPATPVCPPPLTHTGCAAPSTAVLQKKPGSAQRFSSPQRIDHVLPVRLLVGTGIQEPLEVQAVLLRGEGVSRHGLCHGAWRGAARHSTARQGLVQHAMGQHGATQRSTA